MRSKRNHWSLSYSIGGIAHDDGGSAYLLIIIPGLVDFVVKSCGRIVEE